MPDSISNSGMGDLVDRYIIQPNIENLRKVLYTPALDKKERAEIISSLASQILTLSRGGAAEPRDFLAVIFEETPDLDRIVDALAQSIIGSLGTMAPEVQLEYLDLIIHSQKLKKDVRTEAAFRMIKVLKEKGLSAETLNQLKNLMIDQSLDEAVRNEAVRNQIALVLMDFSQVGELGRELGDLLGDICSLSTERVIRDGSAQCIIELSEKEEFKVDMLIKLTKIVSFFDVEVSTKIKALDHLLQEVKNPQSPHRDRAKRMLKELLANEGLHKKLKEILRANQEFIR